MKNASFYRAAALLWFACLAPGSAFAAPEAADITLADGTEVPVEIHPAQGDSMVLWLTSEYGRRPRESGLAGRLAERGVEVWLPDLHSAWFIPSGRYSLNAVDPGVYVTLMREMLARRPGKTLYLMAAGRVVGLSLYGLHAWQRDAEDTARLGGYLMLGPRFFLHTPEGGEQVEYLPILAATNVPSYMFQPTNSGEIWRVAEDIAALEKGGAPVYLQQLPNVGQGFHAREEFSAAEAAMSERLPAFLQQAMRLLASHGGAPAAAPYSGDSALPDTEDVDTLLKPYPRDRQAPALELPTLRGEPVDLAALRGKVVLVNFWATWCPPCVEEIPSLQRLYAQTRARGLEILAIDVGETPEVMEAFLRDKPIAFPVLMDGEGAALRRWGVYAFPTTLILDREHRIRYAVFGAFDWSSREVIETLQPLLAAPYPAG